MCQHPNIVPVNEPQSLLNEADIIHEGSNRNALKAIIFRGADEFRIERGNDFICCGF